MVLKRHILVEFLKVMALTVAAFIALFLLIDIVENADDFMEHDAPFMVAAGYFLLRIPYIFCQVSPIAVLLAVLISLGAMNKHGEISAIRAGGISLMSAFSILFAAGLAITAVVIVINETVTPATAKLTAAIDKKWAQGKELYSYGTNGLWLRAGSDIYHVRVVEPGGKSLKGVIHYRMEGSVIKEITKARRAEWDGGKWLAVSEDGEKPEKLDFTGEARLLRSSGEGAVFDGIRPPKDLINIERSFEDMSFIELRRFIKNLEADDYETERYLVDLYSRLTFPFINFIMVLIAIPFAIRSGRHGGIGTGVAMSVVIGFSYWIVFALSRFLGQAGTVAPSIAAAFPLLLFFAIGAYGISHVRR